MKRIKHSRKKIPCPKCGEKEGINYAISLYPYGVRVHQSRCRSCRWMPSIEEVKEGNKSITEKLQSVPIPDVGAHDATPYLTKLPNIFNPDKIRQIGMADITGAIAGENLKANFKLITDRIEGAKQFDSPAQLYISIPYLPVVDRNHVCYHKIIYLSLNDFSNE